MSCLVFMSPNSVTQLKFHTEQTTDSSADSVGCTMDCMLETQDLAMNGGTPSGAFYPHKTVYVCHERGRTAVGDNTGK